MFRLQLYPLLYAAIERMGSVLREAMAVRSIVLINRGISLVVGVAGVLAVVFDGGYNFKLYFGVLGRCFCHYFDAGRFLPHDRAVSITTSLLILRLLLLLMVNAMADPLVSPALSAAGNQQTI